MARAKQIGPVLGGLVVACLTGCRVGPAYHRPALDVPDSYVAPTDKVAPPSLDWWRRFHSPDLDRLIETAARNSPDLEAAIARVIQADQAAIVAGSPLLPTVTGSANQSWQRSGTAGQSFGAFQNQFITGGQGHYTETRTYSAELTASYEADFWGKNLDALRSAEALALASRYDRETVWLTTSSSIATTYFQAIGYSDRLDIARGNVRDAEQILDAYRARLEAGTASLLDVSQQEALVAGYRAQIPVLESSYRQEVIALSTLVGIPPERIFLAPTTLTDIGLPPVAPGLPASILRRRPDVASAEAQLMAQNETVREDIANFFPSLTLTVSGGVSSLALSAITGPGSLIASFANSLTQTIFDNGLKSGTLGEARGRYRELAADYTKAVLQALVDVETALTQVSFGAEQESLETEAVRTSRRAAMIARAQLEAGTVDIVTVLNTETTLFNDQDTLVQARIGRFLALVSLYRALGGGWEMGMNSEIPGK